MEITETLRDKQTDTGMSDREFAQILGISREYWNLIKNGRRPMKKATLALVMNGVLIRFPELRPAIQEAMFGNEKVKA